MSVRFFKLASFSIILLMPFYIQAQVVINEVSSNNQSLLLDEDGDYEDWIELYNKGVASVNLDNYKLFDLLPTSSLWVFPNYQLAPNSYVIIYASGKDKKQMIHHWETAVGENDVFKYVVPTSELPVTWKSVAFNDAAWNSGKGGLGYGDGDDSTQIPSPAISLYSRKTFTIADTSKIMNAVLHMDYDDGFIAYLNGVEIARANLEGSPPSFQSPASLDHEAKVYAGGLREKFTINLQTLRSILVNGNNVLAIEGHNVNASSSDMTLRVNLSFGIKDASVQFSTIPAWFNEPVSSFHTNFKISKNGGETIYLINNSSILADQVDVPKMNIDHSYGRITDGNPSLGFFSKPTAGLSNNGSVGYNDYCLDSLVFSKESGFYSSAQSITISGSSNIKYTLDGSEPSLNSLTYTNPIVISSSKVLRAACMNSGSLPKKVYTNTYFINEPSTLPVVSLSTAPANFFDDNIGIYQLGPNADSNNIPNFGANFWEDWERPVHVEFFDEQKKLCFEQEAGVRIYGNYSRSLPMKSLLISGDEKYGKTEFDYQFYKNKNITSFKSFVLRNSGNDFNNTHFKDPLCQLAVFKKTAIDIQDYQPCVVFINGKYWGVHQIREKINEHYVASNFGIDKDSVDLTDMWGNQLEGNNDIFATWWSATNTNLAVNANYKVVADSFDIENLVDYFASEIFISNWDWPTNNIKLWRPSYGSKKFRYIYWDTDISMGIWGKQPASFNELGRLRISTNLKEGPHAEIFCAMLKNLTFRNYFINRYADLMNTIYRPDKFKQLAYQLRDQIAPEMPKHFNRWNTGNMSSWGSIIAEMVTFISDRPKYARKEILTELAIADTSVVTLNASPAGAGIIKINTIYPDTYPWKGTYFKGVPVTITAIPNPGYTFSYWQAPNLIPGKNYNANVSIDVTVKNETFTAYFTGSSKPFQLTISEVNYHSADTADSGDWIELYNFSNSPANISNWVFRDFNDYHNYTFPNNTIIPAGGRLVLCNDPIKFHTEFPSVNNYIGPFNFSLDNSGDMIRLYDFLGNQYLSMTYGNSLPWESKADGLGYTLENVNVYGNINSSSTWASGCKLGSPGTAPLLNCVLGTTPSGFNKAGIEVFPNPGKGIYNLAFKNIQFIEANYTVVNALGQLVKTGKITNTGNDFSLGMSDLPNGMYSIYLNAGDRTYTQKIIKE